MTKQFSISDRKQFEQAMRKAPDRMLDPVCRVEASTGDVVIENGNARIILQSDGTIRLEGLRIVAVVEEQIDLNAAVIRLN